jgi:hypothetical protein
MRHRLYRARALTLHSHHHIWAEAILVILALLIVFSSSASAAMRFQERSLYMSNVEPGEISSYTISFRYMSPAAIGSVDMLFCVDPIPYHPCVAPAGLDVSQATLVDQIGETGFSILSQTTNHIILTRTPSVVTNPSSSYVLGNIANPTDPTKSFSIRLKSHTSTDASGSQIDFGSIKGQVAPAILIETQVPPVLIFCVAEQVAMDCSSTNENYYANMGYLDPESTLVAQSQMAVGTNATAGFAITVNGAPMSSGINTIESLAGPTESLPGNNQFGINLVANTAPEVGQDPENMSANVFLSPDYGTPDMYKYAPGDILAHSTSPSLMRKFTASYIVNTRADLRPGVYTTTVTYVASGRF